jgi:hypothetical protein
LRIGDANDPLSATTWWFEVSRFVQVTLSPKAIVTEPGEKPDFVIRIPVVAAPADEETESVATPASTRTSLRMEHPLFVSGVTDAWVSAEIVFQS